MRIHQLVNTMTKEAGHKLSGTVDTWNEEIMKQFFEENNCIPREYNIEIKLNEVDENRGYGVGSIVVWHDNNRINFPIIINSNDLSPFDVFYSHKNEKKEAYPASKDNILKELSIYNIGKPESYNKNLTPDLNLVGGIPQRSITKADEQSTGQANFPSIEKMAAPKVSFFNFIKKSDLDKISYDLILDPGIAKNFYDNTGGLINRIIKYNGYQKFSPKKHFLGKLDTTGLFAAKKQIVLIDNEFINKKQFVEILPGTVCELRCKTYGSMEDILSLNELTEAKLRMGEPLTGVVLKEFEGFHHGDLREGDGENVFISPNYVWCQAGSKWNITLKKSMPNRFYGTPLNISIDLIINSIKDNVFKLPGRNHPQQSAEFYRKEYSDDGEKYKDTICYSGRGSSYYLLTKINNEYGLVSINQSFDQILHNGNYIYKGENAAFVIANVNNIVKISSVEDISLKSLIGNINNIYLVPQSSFLIPLGHNCFRSLGYDNFISPENNIRNDFVNGNVEKIGVQMRNDGIILTGKPIDELRKVASIKEVVDIVEAKKILIDHGVPEKKITSLFKFAAQSFLNGVNDPVYAYNVKPCIYNTNVVHDINSIEKRASEYSRIMNEFIDLLKQSSIPSEGTAKMASLLTDQNAVDVVLSVNYINEDNIDQFVKNIDPIKETLKNLADMLVASRMGLKVLDEENLKKCMRCLDSIIKGLENLKLSIQV